MINNQLIYFYSLDPPVCEYMHILNYQERFLWNREGLVKWLVDNGLKYISTTPPTCKP